jgi:hypothetical protein
MVFPLDVMQPPAYAKERLVRRKMMFGFRNIDKADGLQKLDAIRFPLKFPKIKTQ